MSGGQCFIEDEFIDLSFLEKWESYSVTMDNGVVKYQEFEMEGETPFEFCKCSIKYEGRKQNGQLIDQKRDRNQLVNVKLFMDEHILGIHYALSQMKIGEKAWFEFTPKYHYFKYESRDKQIDLKNVLIDKSENLYYYIELLDYQEPKKKQNYNSFESIYQFYTEKKEEGNEFFKRGDFQTAYKRYERALNAYQCFPKPVKYSMSNQQKSHLYFLLARLYSNTAQCELKLSLPNDCITSCKNCQKFTDWSKDVLLQPQNDEYIPDPNGQDFMQNEEPIVYDEHQIKIYYRMGEAYFQLKDFFQAYEWLQKSGNTKRIKDCMQQLKIFNKHEQKLFASVINNLDKEKEQEQLKDKIERSKKKQNEKKVKEDVTIQNLKHGRLMDFATMENLLDDVNVVDDVDAANDIMGN